MAKLFSISVLFIYLVLSAGLQLTTHYCHGELESVKVLADSKACCCGTDEADSNCCSNEVISIQAEIDFHVTSENKSEAFNTFIIVYQLFSFTDSFTETDLEENSYFDHYSPPPPQKPLWLLHSSFTFYG